MVSPSVIKVLARELATLAQSPPDGIRVSLDDADVLSFSGWVSGAPSTPYEGGCFRITFDFDGIDFPVHPPRCRFATPIFHPNVSSAGEICVSTLQKDWTRNHGVQQILLAIKCLLIHPNPDSALNPQASSLMHEDWQAFVQTAAMWTQVHAAKVPPCLQDAKQPTPNTTGKVAVAQPLPRAKAAAPPAPRRGLRRL